MSSDFEPLALIQAALPSIMSQRPAGDIRKERAHQPRRPLCANGAFFIFGLFAAISARQFCFRDSLSQLVQFAYLSNKIGRLVYSAFAETFLAGSRIDFAARFRWLLDLLKPRAVTGGANNFGQDLTPLFHNDQSLKQNTNLNSFVGR
jgi:hypothetical protein